MFPRTYFPDTYYARTYWPSGAVLNDLLDAIWAWFSNTAIGNTITGGLWVGRAPVSTTYPVATMNLIASVPSGDTSTTTVRRDAVQVAVWHSDKELARAAGTALYNGLLPADQPTPLVWAGGVEMQRYPAMRSIRLEIDQSLNGIDLWQSFFTFEFWCLEPFGAGS